MNKITISAIIHEFEDNFGYNKEIPFSNIVTKTAVEYFIKEKLYQLLDSIPCEEKEELKGFDTNQKCEFRILGYNDKAKEIKQWISEVKK